MKEYSNFLKNIFNFNGRARRREYWVVSIINLSILILLYAIFSIICAFSSENIINIVTSTGDIPSVKFEPMVFVLCIPIILWTIFCIFSAVSLLIRRCHDVGLSGSIAVLCIIGYILCGIGSIAQFIISLLPSKEDNQYGPNPKSPENNEYDGPGGIIFAIVFYIISCIIMGIGVSIYAAKTANSIMNNTELQDALSKLEDDANKISEEDTSYDIDEDDEDFITTEAVDIENTENTEGTDASTGESNADGSYTVNIGDLPLEITLPDIAKDVYSYETFLQYSFEESGLETYVTIEDSFLENEEDMSSYLKDAYNSFFNDDAGYYNEELSMAPTETTINGHKACRFKVTSNYNGTYMYNCEYLIDIGASDYLGIIIEIVSPEELSTETIDDLADLGI